MAAPMRAANRASVRALEVHQTRSSSVSSQDHPAREFYRRKANAHDDDDNDEDEEDDDDDQEDEELAVIREPDEC